MSLDFSSVICYCFISMKTGDVCPDDSQARSVSEIVTKRGTTVVLNCEIINIITNDKYFGHVTIDWNKHRETILRQYIGSVDYYNGYTESDVTYNTTDYSLTLHNVTPMHGGCYRCDQYYSKDPYDYISVTTASGKCKCKLRSGILGESFKQHYKVSVVIWNSKIALYLYHVYL